MNYTELVEKAKKKDEKAIEELFQLTSKKGYFVALKYLKNQEDAQDILQDAYVSSLTKLDQLKDPSKYDKWLFQIIANKAKNYLVKNKPLLFEQLENDDEDSIQFEETITDDRIEFQPKENTDYQELKTALKNLIDELPDDQRMCLLMYYFEELSINEIADSLELNTNTIKSRLNYARNKIKVKVEELQKQGTHLFGVAPIPFLVWMLLEEEQAMAVPQISTHLLISQAMQESGKMISKQGLKMFGKTVSIKTIVSAGVTVLLVIAGSFGFYQNSQNQKKKEIYDGLSIEFSDKLIYEYGVDFDESELILSHTGDIKSLNTLDIKKIGKQTLKYVVSKNDVERDFEITVEVKDTKKPILNLTKETVELFINDKFNPIDYIKEAYDEIDGDLKEQIIIDNPVNMKKAGEYKVKYSLTDENELNSETMLKVVVKEKQEKSEETSLNQTDKRQTFKLDKLGLSMKVPDKMSFSGINVVETNVGSYVDANGNTVIKGYMFNNSSYSGKDPSLFGQEGLVITINYYPFSSNFYDMEGSQGLKYSSVAEYKKSGYEAYDKGKYIKAIKQGIDYPISGTAWIGDNDNESIAIRVQSKSEIGVYAINIRVNNTNRGFSLGIDGFKEKRIQIAREIFDSIQ